MLKLITATELKLKEAEYQLEHMRESYSHPNSHYFRYDLNAFLTAARSVTNLPKKRKLRNSHYIDPYYLEQEFGNKPDFQIWYDTQAQALEHNSLMKFMHDERDIAVHFNYDEVHTHTHTEVIFVDPLNITSGVKMVSTNVEDGTEVISESTPQPPLEAKPTETTTKRTWSFRTNELSGSTEVISICEQFLAILKGLIEDCRKQGFC